ncbi:YegS/Rv2252/BmrU family lipid kinase [Rhodospirillaceae bacterium KN72]|uniref:YegS/Rv2252/BmrU family lipid kinase n=1 Tax=Pacificispira spongiicola TaxID=2729598 RepID=A0A7Y0HCR2_9PROT|nr:YegS/Rv2252/BmrU family lipid kinase [Pacificispira spongiicola]NMM42996.1 YegS/Rv2252/BmrU family lipid kinase [Pacificispira spongiicola]
MTTVGSNPSHSADTQTAPQRAVCFVNPNARAARDQTDAFVAALEGHGVSVTLKRTKSREEALDLIDALPETDAILVGGGDGTISGLLPSLLKRPEPIGILPLGTANDFARNLSIPADPQAAAAVIAGGHRVAVDTGVVGDRPFLNVVSLGISVEIASMHEDGAKKLLGRFAYPIRWSEAWRRHRPLKLEIDVDGEKRRTRCSLLGVGCGRHYGGGLTLDEQAKLNDGFLHLYYVTPKHALHWVRFLPGLWRGTLRRTEGAFTAQGREVSITVLSGKRKKVNVDGEIVAKTPIKVSVRPRSLTVFAPVDAPEDVLE